ncbi:MAG TPA: hypothetical protein VGH28_25970 [Polyangiaceae bacterium]|jgi:hypothetical protein
MKPEIKLTLAALLFPLATACVAQAGTGENVDTSEQDLTVPTQAEPPQAAMRVKPAVDQDLARKFTTTTIVGAPAGELPNAQDPTTPKQVECADPVPVPWDPAKSGH